MLCATTETQYGQHKQVNTYILKVNDLIKKKYLLRHSFGSDTEHSLYEGQSFMLDLLLVITFLVLLTH